MKNINKKVKIILYLIIFCLVAIGINVLFSVIEQEEITRRDIIMSCVLALILWLFYLLSGKLKL